jgi:DNA-directed RNA polymerase subunit RPC12/RpoP
VTDASADRYIEECHHCGGPVEAFTRRCPTCGFRRDTFEPPYPELGGFESDGPECSNCFKTLTAIDLDELELTGCCPHCGHDIISPADSQDGDANA